MATSFHTRLSTAPEEGAKAPCKVATRLPITLSGEQTVSRVDVVAGDRVLVRAQTNPAENGIYDVNVGAWTRSTDWNDTNDVVPGVLVTEVSSKIIYTSFLEVPYQVDVTLVSFGNVIAHSETIDPVGGAESLLITGWSEFSYSTVPVIDDGESAVNAVLDQRVNGLPATSWESDFLRVIRDELPRTKARRLVLWYQWFSYKDSLGTAAPRLSFTLSQYLNTDPDLYMIDCSAVGGVKWNVDGSDGGTAVPVGPDIPIEPGGTVADKSLVDGIRELTNRGYEVGLCPIVSFYDPTKFATNDYLYWRGLATWPDLATFLSWVADYKILHRHAIELYQLAECKPWVVYIGSEMRWLSADASNDIKSAWFLAMQDLAIEWKTAFPDCKITYSASDYEVGYTNGDYPLDALWTHSHVDYVGYSWYKPLALFHTNDPGALRAGMQSGERFDYYTDYDSLEPGRLLSGSDGTGKNNVTLLNMPVMKSWQNAMSAEKMAHYSDMRDGVLSATSPLEGHFSGMTDGTTANAVVVADLIGTATLQRTAGSRLDVGPGLLPAPPETDYYLYCDGTQYAKTDVPPVLTLPIVAYNINLTFKPITAASTYPRAFRVAGTSTVCTIEADRTTPTNVSWKFSFKDTSALNHYYTIANVDETSPVTIEAVISITATSLTVNGTVYDITATPPLMPVAGDDIYLGAYNLTTDPTECEIYWGSVEFLTATTGRRYGGQWFFEDRYAGVRSAWTPLSKRPMATEVGFASVEGSCVEPNVFPVATYGTGDLPSPTFFTDRPYWVNKGIEDLYGPYKSTFNQDIHHQAICMDVAVKALKDAGFAHTVAYNLDTRPAKALDATLPDGSPYYGDGLLHRISHAVNGKQAGGDTDDKINYTVTQQEPAALTTAGQCKIFYVRHADTEKDINGVYIRDFTATGDAQIAALPGKLTALGVTFDLVISSPLWRAMNTIKPWLVANNLQAEIWPELAESSWDPLEAALSPQLEGAIYPKLADEQAFVLRDRGYGSYSTAFPYNAKIYAANPLAAAPVLERLNALLRARFAGKGVNILLVGHYHTGSRILQLLQGGLIDTYDPLAPVYATSNTGIHALYEDCTSGDFMLEMYDDTLLYEGVALPEGSPDYPGTHSYACW